MKRVRVNATADAELLAKARAAYPGSTDADLVDHALGVMRADDSARLIDAGYAAYDQHPIDEADDWGDLASFREAAAAS